MLGLKKGGRERKDAGPARRAVPVLVGSRRIWVSQERTVLVTDTKPVKREEFVTGRFASAAQKSRTLIYDPFERNLLISV